MNKKTTDAAEKWGNPVYEDVAATRHRELMDKLDEILLALEKIV